MTGQLSERDEITLSTMALLQRTTVAEQRRQAVRAYCAEARHDPDVAEIVRLILAYRRSQSRGTGNVITIGGSR